MSDENKKKLVILIICIILFFVLLHFLPSHEEQLKPASTNEPATIEQTENTEQETAKETEPENSEEQSTASQPEQEPNSDFIWTDNDGSNVDYQYITPYGTTSIPGGDVIMSDDEVTTEQYSDKKIGKMTIHYLTEDARASSGTIADMSTGTLIFHEGSTEDFKAIVMGTRITTEDAMEIESIDEAKYVVSEFVPAGSGMMSEWEEDDEYYVRKLVGYDDRAHAASLNYTFVPKNNDIDDNIYIVSYVMTGTDLIGTGPKDTTFKSIADAYTELIPDSTFLADDYEQAMKELQYIHYYRSANRQTFGGLTELREASNAWYEQVFGATPDGQVGDLSSMTAEEANQKVREHYDPVGEKSKQEADEYFDKAINEILESEPQAMEESAVEDLEEETTDETVPEE